MSRLTRMYGPAVRCKWILPSWRYAVLHQCIRPLIGAFRLLAIMDISARAISLAARPRPGHSGHQCSHAPGRPNLHLVSSSRRPRQVKRVGLHHSALLISLGSHDRSDGRRIVPTFSRSMIKRAGRSPHRSCTLRSSDPAPERSRRYEPACWRAQSPARCGAAASWPPRSRA